MPLVHTNNVGIFAGVSKQAVELRLPNHCEEMLNCYPTIENGTRRRNPTMQISSTISTEDNQFLYAYDRGLSGETAEQYVITIDDTNGLKVFDVYSNEYKTVTYSGNAAKYLYSSNPEIGFSAMTIKDTTYIVNRDIIPAIGGDVSLLVNNSLLTMDMTGYSKTVVIGSYVVNKTLTHLAPARIKTYKYTYLTKTYYAISSVGATTTITVDGVSVKYTTKVINDGYNIYPETLSEYRTNIARLLTSKLGNGYRVVVTATNGITIYDLSGTALTVSTAITFPTAVILNPPAITKAKLVGTAWIYDSEANNGSNPFTVSYSTSYESVDGTVVYNKIAFIWIKQVSIDTAFPYTFTLTLKETNGTVIGTTTSAATTANGVASALSTWANGLADFTSVSEGTVVKITRDSGAEFDVVMSDTYGSQASSAFKGTVSQMSDVPKTFPFRDTILKVSGVERADSNAYWVKYDGNSWIEWRSPFMRYVINKDTMPHMLVRNPDFTFTLQAGSWKDILVGDEDSQVIPEFIGSPIKDMFFIGGRLGILTANGISLSQQGDLTNFFRTTVLSLLDDSAISTYVDSTKSVGLEYAVELQSSIVLFGDKLQFALDGSKGITPSTISVQPISGFEINRNVKPISSGDSIFFLVSKNNYSSLMEMNKTTISMNIRANDVSAHVPNYINSDIMQIVASQRDNVVFLRSRTQKNILWVYKHFGTEQEKKQMAWSKWEFSMDISSIFVFDKHLYMFGSRYDSTVPLEEFSLVGVWDDTKYWIDETYWVDVDLLKTPSFEIINIDSYDIGSDFRDNGTIRYNSEVELSEWFLAKDSVKEITGNLMLKTLGVASEPNSSFYLVITDKERNTSRSIPAIYTVDRRPYISGNSKNMRIKIISTNGDGFQINAISTEGQYNVRSKRI